MIDGFDIVPIRIKDEGCIIAGMIGPIPRRAEIPSAMRQRGSIKGTDRGSVLRLKGKMVASGQFTQSRRTICRRDNQLIRPKIIFRCSDNGDVQHRQNRPVEILTRLQVPHDQLDMINQPATMQLNRSHGRFPQNKQKLTRRAGGSTGQLILHTCTDLQRQDCP